MSKITTSVDLHDWALPLFIRYASSPLVDFMGNVVSVYKAVNIKVFCWGITFEWGLPE